MKAPECLIIGDIAGCYKTLRALLKKAPDVLPISVGDLSDRGRRSKQVIDFFMKKGLAIQSNHGHLMTSAYRCSPYYENGLWYRWNGGAATVDSFVKGRSFENDIFEIPVKYIEWLEKLPLYLEYDDLLITHAPICPYQTFEECLNLGTHALSHEGENSIIWNRAEPIRRTDKPQFNVHGHQSQIGLKTYTDKLGDYAMCIDTSRKKILTGLHWPSKTIYQQEYID